MKKGLSFFASMALMTATLISQTATEPVQIAAKNNIMVGAGAINGMYILVKNRINCNLLIPPFLRVLLPIP